ncbi:uncharacterized protein PRCAT00004672001 [Priceomyces carsonii]|uniref:uncharacterized protein n=1 Tax=Priceomyces carsonii TaxID=28549 RepID=UPI002ED9A775|nr:unnamed protein product [Priceomyces carsonii]
MKLKLRTQSTEALKSTLSLISRVRRFVVLRFTYSQLYIILVDEYSLEPQVWCKLQMNSIFDQVEIQSLKDNTILLEINIDLFLQTLKHFDRANSDGLNIRLQRKDTLGGEGVATKQGRVASLAMYYSNINSHQNSINHTFRIPVKIMKNNDESFISREPELRDVQLMMKLPNEFVTTYKRLEKFKKPNQKELLTIKASRRNEGLLAFVLKEEGKYRVTITWNNHLEVIKPDNPNLNNSNNGLDTFQSIRESQTSTNEEIEEEDREIHVKLKDWLMSSRIVATCKSILFLMTLNGCMLHCLLDDAGNIQITYHITGVVVRSDTDNM